VVHIATPPQSHFAIGVDALKAGAHLFVEKPITESYEAWVELRRRARDADRLVVEDYNYRFDPAVLRIDDLIASGQFGPVRHVDVRFFQAIGDPSHAFGDRNALHPTRSLPAGAISDFLPHMASLVQHFVGSHESVTAVWRKQDAQGVLPSDSFVGLIDAHRGTATMAFNANSLPEGFWLAVHGANMQATVNFYDGRLTIDRAMAGPSALVPVRNGLRQARDVGTNAVGSLVKKVLGGPGNYRGLWVLIERFYSALATGGEAPVHVQEIDDVNRLVAACTETALPA